MITLVIIILLIGVTIFFIMPQLAKFRATLGIDRALESKSLPFFQKLKLRILGLKTPFVNGLSATWTFFLAEGGSLSGFSWDRLVSAEHAVWITFSLFMVSLWSHFSGLNVAAASSPIISQLPDALPLPPIPSSRP